MKFFLYLGGIFRHTLESGRLVIVVQREGGVRYQVQLYKAKRLRFDRHRQFRLQNGFRTEGKYENSFSKM